LRGIFPLPKPDFSDFFGIAANPVLQGGNRRKQGDIDVLRPANFSFASLSNPHPVLGLSQKSLQIPCRSNLRERRPPAPALVGAKPVTAMMQRQMARVVRGSAFFQLPRPHASNCFVHCRTRGELRFAGFIFYVVKAPHVKTLGVYYWLIFHKII